MGAWRSPMQISLHAFLSMTTTTLLRSWSGITNRVCEVCSASWSAPMLRSRTISRRRRFCGPTRTSAASAAKRVFRPGCIGSPTIVTGKKRGKERNLLASMKLNWKPNTIRKPSIPLSAMIFLALSNCFPFMNAAPLCSAARTASRTMKPRGFSTFRSEP
ncbi:MAG: hypothetical protein QOE26_1583 [Verrucomicrobiota bacterium]